MIKRAFYILLLLSACGCATSPETPEQKLNYRLENIKTHHKNGDIKWISQNINEAMSYPNATTKLAELLTSNPKIYSDYVAYLQAEIPQSNTPVQIIQYANQVKTNSIISAFQPQHIEQLKNLIKKTALEKNASNEIQFTHADDLRLMPYLEEGNHSQIIIDRTIRSLQENKSGNRPISSLIGLIQKHGLDSPVGQKISTALPTLNIRRSELAALERWFPSFYEKRLAELSFKANLQFKGMDRLASDDLSSYIKARYKSVDWTTTHDNNVLTIVVEKIRHDEKTIPETINTITYAYHQVNILSAVLLMPNNASFLYDIVTSGNEIEYGYVVSASKLGRTSHDEVVRGKVGGAATRCQNARIQNVFGGVSPANFVANDDMTNRCSGSAAASIEESRKGIIEKVGEAVRNIAEVKKSIDTF